MAANRSRGAHMIALFTGLVSEGVMREIAGWRPPVYQQPDADKNWQQERAAAKRKREQDQFIKRGYR